MLRNISLAAVLLLIVGGVAAQDIRPAPPGSIGIVAGQSIAYSGAGGPPAVWYSVYGKSLSGNLTSPDATGTTSPLQFYIGNDTVTGIGLAAMQVEDGIGAGFGGGRIGIQGKLVVNGAPGLALGSGLTGVTGQTTINANLTGIAGVYSNYSGTGFGVNSQVIATANATFVSILNGLESDVELQTSGSVAEKHGLTVVATANDAVRATYDDSAIEIADQNQSNFVGWGCGLCLGGYGHLWPFTSTSTLIGVVNRVVPSSASSPYGIGLDLSLGTATSAQIKAVGMQLDPNGNGLWTSTTSPSTMASGTVGISGLITAPVLNANDEGMIFVTAANGLGLEGDGTTYDTSLYNHSGVLAAGVIAGQSWFEVPNLLAVGTNTFLTSGDVISVSKSNNGDGGITITNPAGGGNTAAFTAINLGNSTSVNEALIRLNGGAFSGGNGANDLTISSAGTVHIQGGSNANGTDVGLVVTTGTVSLPNVATGTPAASLCIDASNNIIKKTTTGSCI